MEVLVKQLHEKSVFWVSVTFSGSGNTKSWENINQVGNDLERFIVAMSLHIKSLCGTPAASQVLSWKNELQLILKVKLVLPRRKLLLSKFFRLASQKHGGRHSSPSKGYCNTHVFNPTLPEVSSFHWAPLMSKLQETGRLFALKGKKTATQNNS